MPTHDLHPLILDETVITSLEDVGIYEEILALSCEMFDVRLTEFAPLFAARDWDGLRSLAHLCKGSARQVGARRFASACAVVERQADAGSGEGLASLIGQLPDLWHEARRALEARAARAG